MSAIDRLHKYLIEADFTTTCDVTREDVREAIRILAGTIEPPPREANKEWMNLDEAFSIFLKRLPPSDQMKQLIAKAIKEEIA